MDLLGTLHQVYLGGRPIPGLDVHGGEGWQVCNEVPLAQLVNLLLDQNNLEWTKILGSLKLLHV